MKIIKFRFFLFVLFFTFSFPTFSQNNDFEESKKWCQANFWTPALVASSEKGNIANTSDSRLKDSYTLSLSGGGYRAMLFHIGALRRLNDAKILSKIAIVSSVSGGSITAAILANNWYKLDFDEENYAKNFKEVIEKPLKRLASETIGRPAVLEGLLPFTSAPEVLSQKIDAALFATTSGTSVRLADINPGTEFELHPRPLFIFLATNLQTGELWQFRSNAVGGAQTGWTEPGDITLSDTVVASAGFPPFFAPLKLDLSTASREWRDCREYNDTPYGADPQNEPIRSLKGNALASVRSMAFLADGGIRDNLGVSAIEEINRVRRLRNESSASTRNLISDGGAATPLDQTPSSNWVGVLSRVMTLMSDQPNDLRVGYIVRNSNIETQKERQGDGRRPHPCDSYAVPPVQNKAHKDAERKPRDEYAYWSIRMLPKIHQQMKCPKAENGGEWMSEEIKLLATVETDLAALESPLQARLINWGYLAAHHGLPYLRYDLYDEEEKRMVFIQKCDLPFNSSEFDPDSNTPSTSDVRCLRFYKKH